MKTQSLDVCFYCRKKLSEERQRFLILFDSDDIDRNICCLECERVDSPDGWWQWIRAQLGLRFRTKYGWNCRW